MRLVEFNGEDGEKILVNPESVVSVCRCTDPGGHASYISTVAGPVLVVHAVEDVRIALIGLHGGRERCT